MKAGDVVRWNRYINHNRGDCASSVAVVVSTESYFRVVVCFVDDPRCSMRVDKAHLVRVCNSCTRYPEEHIGTKCPFASTRWSDDPRLPPT